jgi:hypothetical protein
MKKTNADRLHLERQTVRSLSAPTLTRIVGGDGNNSWVISARLSGGSDPGPGYGQ